MCNGEKGEATGFEIELLGNSRIGIKTDSGNYLRGENNGVLSATGSEVSRVSVTDKHLLVSISLHCPDFSVTHSSDRTD